MKNIILCADDYGQDEAISEGIRQLIDKQRLSAVSCMVTSPKWPEQAARLKPYIGQIDIGLHFNLTHTPQQFSLPALMRQAFLHQLKPAHIRHELSDQLDCFQHELDMQPNFIDGHQHVHVLPIVRDCLLQAYQQYFPNKQAYIRIPNGPTWTLKSFVIKLTGAQMLRQQLRQLGIPHNTSFSGLYNFSQAKQYQQLFTDFASSVNSNGLIMCHPGLASNSTDDPIANSRILEWEYFSSQSFLDLMAKEGIQLKRFELDQE